MVGRAILLASLISLTHAFSDTHPLLAWSSDSSNALFSVDKSTPAESLLDNLLFNDAVCEYDAVVLIDQPGLHASDLRFLSSSSSLSKTLRSAPSSVQLPYSLRSPRNPFLDIARAIPRRCGSNIISLDMDTIAADLPRNTKHVVCMSMPHLEGTLEQKKALMTDHEFRLASELDTLASIFPEHLVVYAGWHSPIYIRQAEEIDAPAFLEFVQAQAPSNSTLPDGGVLKRYQLLTPGLIMSLLLAFFVLVPTVLMGVSALASIQSPVRMEAPKGFSAQDKKNQ